MIEVKTSIRIHMPYLRSLSLSSFAPFYCCIIDRVLRTCDSDHPLALDDEEDEDDLDNLDDTDEGIDDDSESLVCDLFSRGAVMGEWRKTIK